MTIPRPTDPNELPLAIEELFVSRTDPRGVIQAGNAVFQRMCGYDWDRILGAPHKLIRNPDMPSGVFELFWSELKAGRKVGAYVKNRAADGRYYWVFAVAMPAPDGYVSVRIKPTAPMLDLIRPIYADLRRRESEEGLDPKASRDAFLLALHDLGYPTYSSFMAAALEAEYAARVQYLGRTPPLRVRRGQALADAIRKASENAVIIARLFEEIRGVPTNIRILAAQLERGGGPIGVISTNHTTLSEEMMAGVTEFRAATERTGRAIEEGVFRACASALIDDITDIYQRESGLPDAIDVAFETELLSGLGRQCAAESDLAMASIATQAQLFAKVAMGVKRHVAGLDVTRIMCKIENARLGDRATGLSEIIDRLEEVQARIAQQLAEIERASRTILASAQGTELADVA